jgi:hypothetical protein
LVQMKADSPVLLASVILEMWSCFTSRLAWATILIFVFYLVGMTGTHHCAQLFPFRWDFTNFSCLGWPQTLILQISTSWVARIIGLNHCIGLKTRILYQNNKASRHG